MNRIAPLLTFSIVASLAVTAPAQIVFDPSLGLPLGMSDDSIAPGNALGFPFAMPGGVVVTAIDIDSNGRVAASLSGSDYSESVFELLGGPALICPLWDDINPGSPLSDDVYFNAYHNGTQNVALVTWNNVVKYSGSIVFTVQLQLFDDHRFGVMWSATTPSNGIVGASQGGGARDPGAHDLDCGPLNLTFGDPTVYEWFTSGAFDLAGRSLEFVPDGSGGFLINGFEGSGAPFPGQCPGLTPPATATRSGASCWMNGGTPPQALDFLPDGAGGYIVVPSMEPLIPDLGTTLGHTSTSVRTAQLGFPFTMPGGRTVTAIDIDSHGRILTVGADASDRTPTVAEFVTQSGGMIAAFWQEFALGNGGRILFHTDGVGLAVVTWDDVRQGPGPQSQSVQVQLRAGGIVTLILHDTANRVNRGLLIGLSAGRGGDPGEADLTALPVATAPGAPTVYEHFEPISGDVYDIQAMPPPPPLDFGFTSRPVIGQTLLLTLGNLPPTASQAFVMIGFANLNVSLGPLGAPSCFLYSANHLPAVPMTWAGPGATSASLALPVAAGSSTGIPLVLQAAVIDTDPLSGGWNLGTTSLVLSNAVEGVTGS